ncbi:MAG TPA: amidohydrolase family protein [Gammaproteobacteria bacterium]|nr:amidohydrolase family protein [Gammaproteobacteria bacterium]
MHFPITDSHLHLWDDKNLHYPWLDSMPMLNRAYSLSDLMEATKTLHLESCVFVQSGCEASEAIAEVHWVMELAKRDARIHGMVAHAALEMGNEIRPHLEFLKSHQLVKGVRRLLLAEKNDFCLQENFLQGVKLLSDFNFSFDICINAGQLLAAIRMVEQCPQVKFILEHLGNPNMTAKELELWQKQISELAVFPNVWCKISRLITEETQNWSSDHLKPYIYHAIQEFSYDRVMFGSDWPVVNVASSYSHWVHTLYDLLIHHHASEEDLKKLFRENARRCYELQVLAEVPE